MQELLEVGPHDLFIQDLGLQMRQVQWLSQIWKPLRIQMVLQGEQEDKPTSPWNEEGQTLSTYLQML